MKYWRVFLENNFQKKRLRHFVFYYIVYILIINFSFNDLHNTTVFDNWDTTSYLSHAFTIGLDFDLNYENEPTFLLKGCINPARNSPCHPIGSGLLAAPFVAAFSIIDRIQGHSILTDHASYLGSWSYFGFEFASCFYFFAGIALYQRALRRWMKPAITAVLCLSAGVLPYVLFKFAFSHAFEFFTIGLVLYGLIRLYDSQETKQEILSFLIIVLGSAGAILVRWVDINFFSLPLLILPTVYWLDSDRQPFWSRKRKRFLVLSYAALMASLCLVSIVYLYSFGVIWPTSSYFYSNSKYAKGDKVQLILGAIPLLRNVPALLLSSEYGLVYTYTAFPIGVLTGLFMWLKYVRREVLPWTLWLLGILWCVGIPFAIVLIWKTTASAYGYRYLLPALPALLLSAALFCNLERIENFYRRDGVWTRGAIGMTLMLGGALAAISLLSQFGFLKLPGFNITSQINVFGVKHSFSARGYMDAVFAAILNPWSWSDLVRTSLLWFVMIPTGRLTQYPQVIEHYRILAFIVPALGALFAVLATSYGNLVRIRSVLVAVVVVAVPYFASRVAQFPPLTFGTIRFGTSYAESFVGKGFSKEQAGFYLSWIDANPAELRGRLPNANRISLKARIYTELPDQSVKILVNGREVGRWPVAVGYSEPSLEIPLMPNEGGAPALVQFLVDRFETNRKSRKSEHGVMVEWIDFKSLPDAG